MYSVITVLFTRSLKILAGFLTRCARRLKKKTATDEVSAYAFPDVGLLLKAVGVHGAEQRRSPLPPPLHALGSVDQE